jgi:hypothetical protein
MPLHPSALMLCHSVMLVTDISAKFRMRKSMSMLPEEDEESLQSI